jgi:hypothetical protein
MRKKNFFFICSHTGTAQIKQWMDEELSLMNFRHALEAYVAQLTNDCTGELCIVWRRSPHWLHSVVAVGASCTALPIVQADFMVFVTACPWQWPRLQRNGSRLSPPPSPFSASLACSSAWRLSCRGCGLGFLCFVALPPLLLLAHACVAPARYSHRISGALAWLGPSLRSLSSARWSKARSRSSASLQLSG